ncbi:MAG: hypothetical protein Q9M37_05645 [Desulfonauticus sp.]|nr:hypothetical protein [Desulfonauticus sp.]
MSEVKSSFFPDLQKNNPLLFLGLQGWENKTQLQAKLNFWANTVEERLQALLHKLSEFDLPPQKSAVLPHQDKSKYFFAKLTTQFTPYIRLISNGVRKDQLSLISPGSYKIFIQLGSVADELEISIGPKDLAFDILTKLAQALNDSELPLEAKIVYQNGPYSKIPSADKGYVLIVTTTIKHAKDPLQIQASNGLLEKLGLIYVSKPLGRLVPKSDFIQIVSQFSPSTYHSATFDPNAPLNWDLGRYSFYINFDNTQQEIVLQIGTKEAREELKLLASKTQALVKDTNDWEDIVADLGLDPASITDNTTWYKLKVSLKDFIYLEPESSYFELFKQLKSKITTLFNGQIESKIEQRRLPVYTQDRQVFQKQIFLNLKLVPEKTGQRFFLVDGENNLLSRLNLLATAQPGQDLEIKISGQKFTLPASNFTYEQGRVQIGIKKESIDPRAYSLNKAPEEIVFRLENILSSYNAVVPEILSNSWLWQENIISQFNKAYQDNKQILHDLGLKENWDKSLELDYTKACVFLSHPDNYEPLYRALLGKKGWARQLKDLVQKMLDKPISESLKPVEDQLNMSSFIQQRISNNLTGMLIDQIIK